MTTIATTTRGDLSTRTLPSLHAYFDAQQHHPSPAHWVGLDDIATALEDMAGAYTAIRALGVPCGPCAVGPGPPRPTKSPPRHLRHHPVRAVPPRAPYAPLRA